MSLQSDVVVVAERLSDSASQAVADDERKEPDSGLHLTSPLKPIMTSRDQFAATTLNTGVAAAVGVTVWPCASLASAAHSHIR